MQNNSLLSDSDSRQFDRRPVNHLNITATNSVTQETMGKVADISEEGLMLIGSMSVELEHLYQTQLTFESDTNQSQILVGLDCLWIKSGENKETGIVWAGFQIIDISLEHKQHLKDLFSTS